MTRICLIRSAISLVSLLMMASCAPAAGDASSSSDLTRCLIEDLADGQLDGHSLLQAVLIAGGSDEAAITAATQSLKGLKAQVHQTGLATGEGSHGSAELDLLRARLVLIWLHGNRTLAEFDREASRLDCLLSGGRFNCLSASVLLHLLCRDVGLATHVAQADHHAFVVLVSEGRQFEIESTHCLGVAPVAQSAQGTDASNTPNVVRPLSDAQLVALVFFNRGAHYLEQGDAGRAIAFSALAWRLDPGHLAARTNALVASARLSQLGLIPTGMNALLGLPE